MRIILNGRAIEAEEGLNVQDLMRDHHLKADGVIVVVNEAVIAEGMWASTVLAVDDRIELLSLVAGG